MGRRCSHYNLIAYQNNAASELYLACQMFMEVIFDFLGIKKEDGSAESKINNTDSDVEIANLCLRDLCKTAQGKCPF